MDVDAGRPELSNWMDLRHMRPFTPTSPSVGNSVSANLISKILAELRACRIIQGPGIRAKRTPQGTYVQTNSSEVRRENQYRHWVFTQKTDEETGEPVPLWVHKVVQIGMAIYDFDGEEDGENPKYVDESEGEDGDYYLEVHLKQALDINRITRTEPIAIMKVYRTGTVPQNSKDPVDPTVNFYIGSVKDKRQTRGIYCVPVIYTFI